MSVAGWRSFFLFTTISMRLKPERFRNLHRCQSFLSYLDGHPRHLMHWYCKSLISHAGSSPELSWLQLPCNFHNVYSAGLNCLRSYILFRVFDHKNRPSVHLARDVKSIILSGLVWMLKECTGSWSLPHLLPSGLLTMRMWSMLLFRIIFYDLAWTQYPSHAETIKQTLRDLLYSCLRSFYKWNTWIPLTATKLSGNHCLIWCPWKNENFWII